ncbi:MFS transporter [Occultella glacieicola]|uniref:MFS transporter n=1 Tax=Occultella glacieicola TaxID=2518684 RepID=A0ABY2DX77_9MICO|nr:MFS transporter [Occultella glacieicola]TDE88575.1 MFS transporter [Occultella glacieicola]
MTTRTDADPTAPLGPTGTTDPPPPTPGSRPTPSSIGPGGLRMAIVAMALGGFAIGTTEFATMGLLPQIATTLTVSVPTAGTLISAYALGVVIGAPLIVVMAARLERKQLLLLLAAAIALGNAFSAIAPELGSMTASRFLAGLPHGAYFGVASLIAATLAPAGRRARAVSQVMLGLTVATMIGVPLSTALGQWVGWRSAFAVVVVVALAAVVAIWRFVPALPRPAGQRASARGELRAFRHAQVWFTLGIAAVGFGGMFAVYSYIGEIVPQVLGLPIGAVPWILAVFGTGMTVGTLIAGRLADRSVMGTAIAGLVGMAVLLAGFALTAHWAVAGIIGLFAIATISQFLGPSLQTRLLDSSPDAPSLAAALHHSALNIGNAVGAWVGALVLAAGLGYLAPAWAGSVLALGGLAIALIAVGVQWRADAAGRG